MATRKFGKLKINRSEDGFAFRFGDGEIHRLSLRRKAKDAEPEYNEEFDNGEGYYPEDDFYPEDNYASDGYSGRFAQESDRYEDDYEDGFRAYDDRYADDDGYFDEDDGYYGEGDYADDEGAYDDRYLDEDADAYGDASYADESPLMRYIDENDWVTYLLLFVLPPLGIYLLWRRRRFDVPIRWGVSAASAVWFIILVVLLISLIFSGSGDTTTNPPITLTTPQPTVEAAATPGTDDLLSSITAGTDGSIMDELTGDNAALPAGNTSDGITPVQTQDALALDATATPLPGYNAGATGTAAGNTVIMTATGLYYHNNAACTNIEAGASISNVTTDVAQQRGKNACPICYPNQKTFYATSGGSYYHSDPNCSKMQNASIITENAAKEQGKTACPVCITGEVNSLDTNALRFADSTTRDRSGVTVYGTAGGTYYHTNATCSGMQDAKTAGLLEAMLAGKTACPKCAKAASTKVWCTEGGTYFHNKSDCSGMQGAYQISYAEASVLGKKKCNNCWGSAAIGSISSASSTTGTASTSSSSSGSGAYVYGTANGKYYHTNASCSGMTGATRYPLSSMVKSGRAACPVCCSGADTVVYATASGTYYHSYASCSGMQNAEAGTLSQALAYGKQKCPKCWASSGSSSSTDGPSANGTYVYCTKNGTYYHTKSTCSGMSGAEKVTMASAVSAGKRACPTCASAASYMVYSTSGGTYYHTKSTCSGMSGASQRSLEAAVMLGQKACPVCIGQKLSSSSSSTKKDSDDKNSSSSKTSSSSEKKTTSSSTKKQSSNTYRSGTSGIKVYAVSHGKHYHTKSTCSGMSDASYITLETALNYGLTACSKCASSASTTVYAVKNGKYYHYTKSCAGSGAVSGKRAVALAVGLDPCPYCVTKTKEKETEKTTATSSNKYKAGASGIKVYASVNGKYYHADKECAGSSASHITLETAMNYGKNACPSCAASAKKTVYATGSDKYYHTSKTHAGTGAVSGSLAKALAMGKKECKTCIAGSEAYEESDIKYSAPGDTNVYIDLDSDYLYYHKNASCGDAGLYGGTKVTLDFVVSWGYKACPYCSPATSVS